MTYKHDTMHLFLEWALHRGVLHAWLHNAAGMDEYDKYHLLMFEPEHSPITLGFSWLVAPEGYEHWSHLYRHERKLIHRYKSDKRRKEVEHVRNRSA